MMIIDKIFSKTKTTRVDRPIVLKPFVDLYLDTIGWYALGHHDPHEFLTAVTKKEPYADLSLEQVQLTWANFVESDFEITEFPDEYSQAVTIVESY